MRDGFKGTHIKRLDGNRIGGYGIVWGGKDLEGEYFTPDTDFWLDRIPPLNCVLFDHATTPLPGGMKSPAAYVIGKVDRYEFDDYGMWVESLIDEHEEWVSYVMDLVDRGILGYSTDSIAHLTERGMDGFIKSWPIPAISITHHPAEPRTIVGLMKRVHELNELKTIFAQASAVDALKALQAYPEDTAYKAGRTGETDGQDTSDHRRNPMPIQLDAKALTQAFALSHWEQIKSLIDAVKADEMPEETPTDSSKGALEEAMLPVAQQMASLLGIPEDEAMAAVMALAAQYLQSGTAPAAEPEPMPDATSMYEEDPMMGKAAPLQFNAAAFASAVASAQTGAAVHNPPQGAYMVNRQFNFNRNDPDKNPHQLGRLVKSIINWKTNPDDASYLRNHNKSVKSAYAKAQGVDPDTSGGYLVQPERAAEIIGSIKAEATVAPLLRQYPMKSNVLEMPKIETGVEAEMVAENSTIPSDEIEISMEKAYAKKVAVMLKFSDEIRSFSYEDVEAIFTEEIRREFPVKLDSQILRGRGTANELLGLENRPRATSTTRGITVTSLSTGLAYTDLTQMQERLEDTDLVLNESVRWLLDPKGKRIMRELQDDANRLIFTGGGEGTQASGAPPQYLLDYQWVLSNLIVPNPKPAARKIYLCKWDEIVLGTAKQLEIRMSDEAGTSFETDQVWLRAVMHVAMLVRQPEAIQILDNLTS